MIASQQFSDEQVRLILAHAAARTDESPLLAPLEGRSLVEIERIGAEAGISAAAIQRAATLIASGASEPNTVVRRAMGIPTWLSRRIAAGQRVKGSDWKRIVARLRILRDAKGSLRDQDGVREWREQYVRVVVESGPAGDTLYVTARDKSPLILAVPGAFLAAAGLLLVALYLQIESTEKARALWALGVLGGVVTASGGGLIGYALLSLRSWAHEYGRLLESVAAEVPTLLTPSDES
jgi:hypothetical protein